MSFNRSKVLKLAAAGAVATLALLGAASASAQVNWSVGVSVPGVVVNEPAYYPPAPVYVQPAPRYYQPAPPPVYYRAPVPAYAPAPVYYEPAYREGPRFDRRDWGRDHHRDWERRERREHRRDWNDRD